MKKKFASFTLLSTIVFASSAADADAGFFAGISASLVSADYADGVNLTYTDSDIAFQLIGGYMITDMIGFELGYLDLGNFTADSLGAANRVDLDAHAFSVAAIVSFEADEQLDIYGKLGAYLIEADRDSTIGDNVLRENEQDESAFLAIGAEYDFGAWRVFGQYSLADTDVHNLKIDLLSFGVKYEFGKKALIE